jgi:hypothetical protein
MTLITGPELASALQLTYASQADTFDQVAAAADSVMVGLLSPADHSSHAACREAAISVGMEMYTARTAVGGSPVASDFTPGAYRLSAWLTRRVQAVSARCWNVAGWVG